MSGPRFVVQRRYPEEHAGHTRYVFEVTHASGCTWTMSWRYSELLAAHTQLSKSLRGLPPFPPKGIPGMGLLFPTDLAAERLGAFQRYFDIALLCDGVASSPAFQRLLGMQRPEAVSSVRVLRWLAPGDADVRQGTVSAELEVTIPTLAARGDASGHAWPVEELVATPQSSLAPASAVSRGPPGRPLRVDGLPTGELVVVEVRARNGGGASEATEIEVQVPGQRCRLSPGMRVRAVWGGDGSRYDAVVNRCLPNGSVRVDWLRPAPLSGEVLTCVCDAGGDDTAYRTVPRGLVVPLGVEPVDDEDLPRVREAGGGSTPHQTVPRSPVTPLGFEPTGWQATGDRGTEALPRVREAVGGDAAHQTVPLGPVAPLGLGAADCRAAGDRGAEAGEEEQTRVCEAGEGDTAHRAVPRGPLVPLGQAVGDREPEDEEEAVEAGHHEVGSPSAEDALVAAAAAEGPSDLVSRPTPPSSEQLPCARGDSGHLEITDDREAGDRPSRAEEAGEADRHESGSPSADGAAVASADAGGASDTVSPDDILSGDAEGADRHGSGPCSAEDAAVASAEAGGASDTVSPDVILSGDRAEDAAVASAEDGGASDTVSPDVILSGDAEGADRHGSGSCSADGAAVASAEAGGASDVVSPDAVLSGDAEGADRHGSGPCSADDAAVAGAEAGGTSDVASPDAVLSGEAEEEDRDGFGSPSAEDASVASAGAKGPPGSFNLDVILSEERVASLGWREGEELAPAVEAFMASQQLKPFFREPLVRRMELLRESGERTQRVDIVDLV